MWDMGMADDACNMKTTYYVVVNPTIPSIHMDDDRTSNYRSSSASASFSPVVMLRESRTCRDIASTKEQSIRGIRNAANRFSKLHGPFPEIREILHVSRKGCFCSDQPRVPISGPSHSEVTPPPHT